MPSPPPSSDLAVDEQVALVAGLDAWHTVPLPRVGLGSLRVTDGPTGARGPNVEGDDTSACFPVGSALGATWDVDLIGEVGRALATEAREKGAGVLLGPTVNLHRHPLAGRNFECYSEDPYLSARIAVAFVNGLQGGGVGACIKHFVANDSEHRRHTMSSDAEERTLRELYLAPFEAAIREAGAWAVMSGYNRVNGTYCCDHHWLLTEVLRDEWGFDGAVISDWGGTMSTSPALAAGLDLEMPGPGRMRRRRLEAALADPITGPALEGPLAAAAANVERLVRRAEAGVAQTPELSHAEIDALAHRAAVGSMVLLSNDGTLPLDPSASTALHVALIGPNAAHGQVQGGGSSQVRPRSVLGPLDGLRARLGDPAQLTFEPGCTRARYRRPVPAAQLVAPDGSPGVLRELWSDPARLGDADVIEVVSGLDQRFFGPVAGLPSAERLSVRLTTRFTPGASGIHTVGLAAAGAATVTVDGVEIVTASSAQQPGETFYGFGSTEQIGTVELLVGRPVDLVVDYQRGEASMMAGVRVGVDPSEPADLLDCAVAAAAAADVAIVVVGLDGAWETEGSDRVDLRLPGRQDELVAAVAAANPRTVVVVNAGSPLEMPWLDEVAAVVQAWYPGQAFGTALAEVLCGDVDPSGRLPTTFPRRLEDAPTAAGYPGADDHLPYAEGVFMGYRGYDAAGTEPLFAFGHGLSYTTFAYGELSVTPGPSGGFEVAVTVTNTGARAGVEVVQLYVGDEASAVPRPPRELRGFVRLALAPGEHAVARFTVSGRDLAWWDQSVPGWRIEAGTFTVGVGSSSRRLQAESTVEVTEGRAWSAAAEPPS